MHPMSVPNAPIVFKYLLQQDQAARTAIMLLENILCRMVNHVELARLQIVNLASIARFAFPVLPPSLLTGRMGHAYLHVQQTLSHLHLTMAIRYVRVLLST